MTKKCSVNENSEKKYLKLDLDMANSHNTVHATLWTHHYSHGDNVAIVMTNVR